ncbi:MAG: methyl-accepting chemotaxis protein [Planctomycetaceae bacterium]|nr:methyl-accepting chemotaxis protein [Planctomycetaceae bacterium]
MLNKLKIGKKLFVGFLFVLLLLLLVAAGGYLGLSRSAAAINNVIAIEDIQNQIVEVRNIMFQAQITALNGTIYSDKKYSEERKELDKKLREIVKKTKSQLPQEEQNILEKLITAYDEFAALDERWYEIEYQRKHEVAILKEQGDFIITTLSSLSDLVENAMKSQQEAKDIDQEHYFSETRSIQLKQVNHSATIFTNLRSLFYQYLLEIDPKNKETIVNDIVKNLEVLRNELQIISTKLTTDAGKTAFIQIEEALTKWETIFKNSMTYLKTQDQCDIDQTEKIKEMETRRNEIIVQLNGQVDAIQTNSVNTSKLMLTVILITAVIAFILGLSFSFVLSRNITTGLSKIMETLKKVVLDGNLNVEIPHDLLSRQDEIGELSHVGNSVLNDFKTVDAMANALADGNWQVVIKEKSDQDSMNLNLARMLTQVNSTLLQINDSVKQVTTGSGEISSAAQTLSSGAQESAASLEEITASMSEISSQTKANAQSASEARDLAHKATRAAAEGQSAMNEMNDAMDRITKNSTEIQRVIKVIDDIAFQTNLLALNAAVEAARAGVHGKGFAVVAEEVRNLAARSAKAAKETTDLISTSGQEIHKGGEVATHTAEVLNMIVDQIKQTTDLISGIAEASNEQAQGVTQVTIGLQQIDAVTQQNTAAAEESASAAGEMSNMATRLQQLVEQFQLRA